MRSGNAAYPTSRRLEWFGLPTVGDVFGVGKHGDRVDYSVQIPPVGLDLVGSPDSGETIAERLGAIVAAAMGYEPEDLPWD